MVSFWNELDRASESWWPFILTTAISVVFAIRLYISGMKCPSRERMDNKIVVITGASGGIGLATAKELANRGATLVLAVRNAEKGLKAKDAIKSKISNATVIVKIVDVSEFLSIRNFVNELSMEFDRIDVLVNNAGIIFQPMQLTSDGNELTMATNYLGPFLLTHLLTPLLNRSENGRVINVSAVSHFVGKIHLDDLNMLSNFSDKEAFASSKLALTIFTKQMAHRFKKTKITFNSVNPGLVRGTDHLRNSIFGRSQLVKLCVWPWMWLFLKNPTEACQTVVYLAVEPTLAEVSGCYFNNCELKEPAAAVSDASLADELYRVSCNITGVNSVKVLQVIQSTTSEIMPTLEQ